eukprot:CAMPEP_0175733050 /NCGR_PEP_ID=MMETSP0097-20121207/51675_1 /TAXON_ID=311494 /ORGANISM="Alexandrium monilatum, Strain CCMP3105" /LENGTH=315 /DNA_ID=CAMNT_0017041043 /DNA_START=32 /DNA_END=976 /DNA_ORIENTATION=+
MDYYNSDIQQQVYGAIDGLYQDSEVKRPQGGFFSGPSRKRINIIALATALFVPWFIFCGVLSALCFSIHYNSPQMVFGLVGFGLMVVVVFGVLAVGAIVHRDLGQEPTWYLFMFLTGLLAWGMAVSLGNVTFANYFQPFYDIQSLNVYRDVDPELKKGQQMMDAGRIIFVPNARVDTRHAWSFKNQDTYCVAPISTVDANGTMTALPVYDFWAVGLNCCSGNGDQFQCGDLTNRQAHAGLREMRDNLRPFFRLAVQQAQAAYAIKATHPLFFFWMEDPVYQARDFEVEGYRYVLLGICAHFSVQMLLVLLAALTF